MEISALNAVTGRKRRIIRLAAILNLAYFGVECGQDVALSELLTLQQIGFPCMPKTWVRRKGPQQ
jgi:hypothetical protein